VPESSILYGGRVSIDFDETKYRDRYKVLVDEKKVKVPSVTTVTGQLDKPAILPWGIKMALGVVQDSILPGFSYTSEELAAIYEKARNQANWEKRKAANIGTAAHAWVSGWVQGEVTTMPDKSEPHRKCIDAVLGWVEKHNVRFLNTEVPVYSLEDSFVGRTDGDAEVDGEFSIFDLKTGNGIWSEAVLQLSAYAKARREENPSLAYKKGYIIRLGKEDGKFYKFGLDIEALDRYYPAFLGLKAAYEASKEIGKQLRAAEKEARTETGQDWLAELEA